MKISATSHIDTESILRRRGLGGSNDARLVLASEVAHQCDPYVPMSAGSAAHMKDSVQIAPDGSEITYPGPYAHYQYEGKVYGPNIPLADGGFFSPVAPKQPTGAELQYHGAPMRGAHWDKRMMADHADEVVDAVARRVGGTRK